MKNTYLIASILLLIVVVVFARDFNINNTKLSQSELGVPKNLAVSVISIEDNKGLAAILSTNGKEIKWISNNFSGNTGVNINLLRKVSGDPIQYELVRSIVKDTPNDGSYLWVPRDGELEQGLYIEVTCNDSLNSQCVVSGNPLELN